MTIKTRLILCCLLLIALTAGGSIWISSVRTAELLESKQMYSIKQNYRQTNLFLQYQFDKVRLTLELFATDQSVLNILKQPASERTQVDQVQDMYTLIQELTSLQNGTDIQRARLYVQPELLYAEENVNLFSMRQPDAGPWLSTMVNGYMGVRFWGPKDLAAEDNTLAIAKRISSPEDYRKCVGIIRVDLSGDTIMEILRNANVASNSRTMLLDASRRIVLTSGNQQDDPQQDVLVNLPPDQLTQITYKDQPYFALQNKLAHTEWSLLTLVPQADVASEISRNQRELFWMLLGVAFVAVLLSIWMAHSITAGISGLTRQIHSGTEKLSPPKGHCSTEIAALVQAYNDRQRQIHELMEQQRSDGMRLKSAELKALQSQINPHFLYNVLDSLRWLNRAGNSEQIDQMVSMLAQFYRIGLSNGAEEISLQDELKHVRSYVVIQNIRFGGRLTLTVDVESDLLQTAILRTTLQPIVENAIQHGIMSKVDKTGEIRISATHEQQYLLIKVSDNGIGMPPQLLEAVINGRVTPNSANGFGLRNVNQRLKLRYGENCGLTFSSIVGQGTTVTVRILFEPKDYIK